MRSTRFSDSFVAAQVIGSCRLAGIPVSTEDERTITGIICGKIDAVQLRQELIKKFRSQNCGPHCNVPLP